MCQPMPLSPCPPLSPLLPFPFIVVLASSLVLSVSPSFCELICYFLSCVRAECHTLARNPMVLPPLALAGTPPFLWNSSCACLSCFHCLWASRGLCLCWSSRMLSSLSVCVLIGAGRSLHSIGRTRGYQTYGTWHSPRSIRGRTSRPIPTRP